MLGESALKESCSEECEVLDGLRGSGEICGRVTLSEAGEGRGEGGLEEECALTLEFGIEVFETILVEGDRRRITCKLWLCSPDGVIDERLFFFSRSGKSGTKEGELGEEE